MKWMKCMAEWVNHSMCSLRFIKLCIVQYQFRSHHYFLPNCSKRKHSLEEHRQNFMLRFSAFSTQSWPIQSVSLSRKILLHRIHFSFSEKLELWFLCRKKNGKPNLNSPCERKKIQSPICILINEVFEDFLLIIFNEISLEYSHWLFQLSRAVTVIVFVFHNSCYEKHSFHEFKAHGAHEYDCLPACWLLVRLATVLAVMLSLLPLTSFSHNTLPVF